MNCHPIPTLKSVCSGVTMMAFAVSLMLLLTGPAIAADKYRPTPETVPAITRQQAEAAIRESGETIKFRDNGFEAVWRRVTFSCKCSYEKMSDPIVQGPWRSYYYIYLVNCLTYYEGKELYGGKEQHTGLALIFKRKETAIEAANAIYVLKHKLYIAASDPRSEESKFAEEARRYRELTAKPALPEEARKFRVQAENAVAEKRFAEAAENYGKALELAPWWPEGYFNRAVIHGELGNYDDAVQAMQRYLLLVPNAPNARAAQDKIYVWQGKAGQ